MGEGTARGRIGGPWPPKFGRVGHNANGPLINACVNDDDDDDDDDVQ